MGLLGFVLGTLAASGAASAFGADLSIMPVSVQLDAQHDRSTVRVTNQGKAPVIQQADAIGWEREAGVDRDTSTSDLIVNPPVFTVAPGQTQIVRVGLRRDSGSEQETTYRMVLREVPSADSGSETLQGQVRVLVAVRVPVYVAPHVVRRQEHWVARYDAGGQLVRPSPTTATCTTRSDRCTWRPKMPPRRCAPKARNPS